MVGVAFAFYFDNVFEFYLDHLDHYLDYVWTLLTRIMWITLGIILGIIIRWLRISTTQSELKKVDAFEIYFRRLPNEKRN